MTRRNWRQRKHPLTAGITLAILSTHSNALDQWQIDATNRAQTEYYQNSGNESASPYPDDGLQTFNDLSLNLNRRLSAYERMTASFNAVANDSAYRSRYQGGTLERVRLYWEKGDGMIPFRLEVGDFYAFQSTRTIQTSLKGAQAEVQPDLGNQQHSIQFFAGQQAATYRDFDGNQPTYTGASWLLEDDTFGALSFNTSLGRQEPEFSDSKDQTVASVAHYFPFQLGSERLTLDSEFAHFDEKVANESESDKGYAVELSGRSDSIPLSYSAEYSLYGPDYQPFAASVVDDQRSMETSATWRFEAGNFLRARLLDYRDGVETANPTDTRTTGVTYGGQLIEAGSVRLFGNIDGFVTQREDRNETFQTRNSNLSANISLPLSTQLSTRLSLLGQIREDELANTKQYLRQANASVSYRFQIAGVSGSVSPGLIYRENTGDNVDSRDLNPTLNSSLRAGNHSIRASYNSLRQEAWEPGESDVLTQRASLQYSYQHQQHRFGLEGQYYDRQPDNSGTYASRVMAFWEYRFSKAPTSVRSTRPTVTAGEQAVSVTQFAPGTSRAAVVDQLLASGLGEPRRNGDLFIYETPVLENIQRRQRLAYEFVGGRLHSTNLVINFDQIGDGRSAQRTFDQILGDLIRRYGPPELQIEDGDFNVDLSSRLATGQFSRTYQWTAGDQILRFGIPSRIDGQVRMELRYATHLAPAEQNDWSLSELQ